MKIIKPTIKKTPSLFWGKASFFSSIIVYCLLFIAHCSTAQDIPAKPNPPRLVNDFVMKLQPNEREALEQKLRGYADSTSTQISIVIVKTTQPYDIFDYGIKLAKTWTIGQKDKDNGLLILWATEERKIRMFTGRGLEGALPDVRLKRIQRDFIVPAFKQNQFYKGLNEGVEAIIRSANGEFEAEPQEASGDFPIGVIFFLVILFAFLIYIISKRGGGGPGGGRRSYNSGGWFPPVTVSSWGTSSGSNWGGGNDSGGGGFDFGGFGGGDFGGGGAGSDY